LHSFWPHWLGFWWRFPQQDYDSFKLLGSEDQNLELFKGTRIKEMKKIEKELVRKNAV